MHRYLARAIVAVFLLALIAPGFAAAQAGSTAQVTGTVRWRESVLFMAAAGVTNFYEVGAGKVLSGLIKRLAEGATANAIGSPEACCQDIGSGSIG